MIQITPQMRIVAAIEPTDCRRGIDGLARRAAELPSPIQMCDALSRNLPRKLQTIVANCLAHGRRQFVDVAEQFPDECRHVLESLAVVYHTDAQAWQQELSPQEQIRLHQAQSGPVMEGLHVWLVQQLDQRRVEPNSGLGKAMAYLLRHWEKLTLFLRAPGAPLDNNICERALKKALRRNYRETLETINHGQASSRLGAMSRACVGMPGLRYAAD
jgi:non-ribosomal peptide synthetase component F